MVPSMQSIKWQKKNGNSKESTLMWFQECCTRTFQNRSVQPPDFLEHTEVLVIIRHNPQSLGIVFTCEGIRLIVLTLESAIDSILCGNFAAVRQLFFSRAAMNCKFDYTLSCRWQPSKLESKAKCSKHATKLSYENTVMNRIRPYPNGIQYQKNRFVCCCSSLLHPVPKFLCLHPIISSNR